MVIMLDYITLIGVGMGKVMDILMKESSMFPTVLVSLQLIQERLRRILTIILHCIAS